MKYRPSICVSIAYLKCRGFHQTEICETLGITPQEAIDWQNEHMEFREALEGSLRGLNRTVEAALIDICVGYEYTEQLGDKKSIKWQAGGMQACLAWLSHASSLWADSAHDIAVMEGAEEFIKALETGNYTIRESYDGEEILNGK